MAKRIWHIPRFVKWLLQLPPLVILVESLWQSALGRFVPQWMSDINRDHVWVVITFAVMLSLLMWSVPALLDARLKVKRLLGDDPDLTLGDAIAHIKRKKKQWRNVSDVDILKKITDLAFRERLVVWGQPGEFLNFQKNFEDSMIGSPEAPIKVPFHFFYDVAGGLYEDRGFMLSRFREYPESDKVTSYKSIFNVTVNRGQIDAIFSRKKPTSAPPTV